MVKAWIVALALLVVLIGSVGFHFLSPWWFTPIASNWAFIDSTVVITFWLTGVVFIAVVLFMAYCVYRFRHQDNVEVEYEPENKKLETWLTVGTAVAVAGLLAPGLFVWGQFVTVPEGAAEVEVVGQQWQWGFRYPGVDGVFGTTEPRYVSFENPLGLDPDDPAGQDDVIIETDALHLPLDQPVKVLNRSLDVLHDFMVPEFRAKMDMVPGMVTFFWLIPTRVGTFDILCAELCGSGHYAMRGNVIVEEESAFQAWLQEQPTFAELYAEAGKVRLAANKATPSAGEREITQ